MEPSIQSKNKYRISLGIVVVSLVVTGTIIFFTLYHTSGPVLQADAAIYAKIPTEAGKTTS